MKLSGLLPSLVTGICRSRIINFISRLAVFQPMLASLRRPAAVVALPNRWLIRLLTSSRIFHHHSFLSYSCHINPPPKIVVATAAPTPWSWHNKSMYSVRTVVWPFGLLLEKSLKRGEPPFFSPKISKSRTKLRTISRLIRYSFLDCPNPHSTRKNIFIRPPVTSRLDAYSASFQAKLQSSQPGSKLGPGV